MVRLGLPSRLLTILEGEGLVNDASSLVLLSSAVATTTVTGYTRILTPVYPVV
jgi:CPA1 family monovalent cation:H+ antiporter